ncbi:urea ABC transporter ATP-binding subunit UrtE [Variovorax beijingensis]|uniref:High-affinity branched-chain amino acid transport ATP-binding protein LivF n=2 Tax=Variovorax TaxID=34072 RepID=A0A0H2M8H9_VARPD|nr:MULTISPECIES: urea ABC transporter ATP-binding subunit UrtE [Variovorax]KLN53360.1 high-affinity branched-chain amino acid transport ATP-binding protein LivF [Variovorax paradoxus]RSZ32884.1 urea ABC transporter ATP-binding subunit UrtE [Variovorax beijingensis]
MLKLSNINGFYGRSHALQDVDLTIPAGKVTAILGRNGMGKTTLLRTLMGSMVRSTGAIELEGVRIDGLPTHLRARSGIAYVPQGREIIADFSVRQNILMGAFAGRGPRAIPPLALELFPYLAANLHRPGGVLSGGQQQQLALARALAAHPKVMLLDEPNEGIQPSVVEEIESAITRLNREFGMTMVLVEQNIDFARRVASHFAMFEKGSIVESGPIDRLTNEVVDRHMTF